MFKRGLTRVCSNQLSPKVHNLVAASVSTSPASILCDAFEAQVPRYIQSFANNICSSGVVESFPENLMGYIARKRSNADAAVRNNRAPLGVDGCWNICVAFEISSLSLSACFTISAVL